MDIEVDGGITRDNVQVVLDAGANIIVAGSAIFNGNIAENVKNMMEILAPGRMENKSKRMAAAILFVSGCFRKMEY